MKKNKTVAYMMAAMLLVGGTFVGTKALFTDEATLENKLKLTTGKVDIDIEGKSWYKNLPDGDKDGNITNKDNTTSNITSGKYEQKSDTGEFTNVEPGDMFTREIVIKNYSSYDKIDVNLIKAELNKDYLTNNGKIAPYIRVNFFPVGDVGEMRGADDNGPRSITGYVTVTIEESDEAWKALNGAGSIDLNAVYQLRASQKPKPGK